jgi:phosphoribosylaminoimidazole-succinocarboxamide synthase
MKAIQELKEELLRVQQAQSDCISDQGYILNHKKYEYNILVQTATYLKASIEWMEKLAGN